MALLIVKMAGMLIVACALGAWLGYWWALRRMEDVTREHASLRELWNGWRLSVEERLADRPEVDFSQLHEWMAHIEDALRNIAIPPAETTAVLRTPPRNLLTHAAYGEPDDLKRIVGVGAVLERMLHGIGVYYFWQIAEWTPEDVKRADALLPAFHGRIERNHWVTQATEFVRLGTAAARPAELQDADARAASEHGNVDAGAAS
jgi:predicted flap endonuclease-1-like 5' DNA nuclease